MLLPLAIALFVDTALAEAPSRDAQPSERRVPSRAPAAKGKGDKKDAAPAKKGPSGARPAGSRKPAGDRPAGNRPAGDPPTRERRPDADTRPPREGGNVPAQGSSPERDPRTDERSDRDPRPGATRPAEQRDAPGTVPRDDVPQGAREGNVSPRARFQPATPGRLAPRTARPLVTRTFQTTAEGRATLTDASRAREAVVPRVTAPSNLRGLRDRGDVRAPRGDDASAAPGERRSGEASGAPGERHTSGEAAGRRHESAGRHRSAAAGASRHRNARASYGAYRTRYTGYRSRWYYPSTWGSPWYPGYAPYWYHGVFVYGPYPWYHHDHVVYVDEGRGRSSVHREPPAPERVVDRDDSVSVGVRVGSYVGSYDNGASYGDAATGLSLRYRPEEAYGFELAWLHADQQTDALSARTHDPVQASVQVYAAPWSRFSPYVSTGVTFTGRSVDDVAGGTRVVESGTLWGPHLGLGAEIALGQGASLNAGMDVVGYVNRAPTDLTTAGAMTTNVGVNFYF